MHNALMALRLTIDLQRNYFGRELRELGGLPKIRSYLNHERALVAGILRTLFKNREDEGCHVATRSSVDDNRMKVGMLKWQFSMRIVLVAMKVPSAIMVVQELQKAYLWSIYLMVQVMRNECRKFDDLREIHISC